MTDTAKPTPSKGCTVKLWDRASFRYFVSDEAVDVYHETNLTPRQLLERVREWEAFVSNMIDNCDRSNFKDSNSWVSFIQYAMDEIVSDAKAALAKHGEDV